MSSAAASAAAKAAVKEARKWLARGMSTEEWRLAGRIEVDTTAKDGVFLVSTPPEDPVRLEHVPTGRKLAVPFSSMETDFASVPKAAQRLGAKSPALHLRPRDYELAAFFHDQLYAAGWCWAVQRERAVKVPVTKTQADAMLFVALECCGATHADGLAYHGAVSLFGGKAWKRCRERPESWPELFSAEGKEEKAETRQDAASPEEERSVSHGCE